MAEDEADIDEVMDELRAAERSEAESTLASEGALVAGKRAAGETDDHFYDPEAAAEALDTFREGYVDKAVELPEFYGVEGLAETDNKNLQNQMFSNTVLTPGLATRLMDMTDGQLEIGQVWDLEPVQQERQGMRQYANQELQNTAQDLPSERLVEHIEDETGVSLGSDFYEGQNAQYKAGSLRALDQGNFNEFLEQEIGYNLDTPD